jgi:hypothetical protein
MLSPSAPSANDFDSQAMTTPTPNQQPTFVPVSLTTSMHTPMLSQGVRDYAIGAGARLCDPGKPLLLNLAVEALIASRALAAWAKTARQAPGARRRSERRRDRSRVQDQFDRRKGIFAGDARHAGCVARAA